jgi:predicted metal-dependent phosphoesterase TrpH
MLRADLHIHTADSMDSTTSVEQVVARCLETGISCIAVTDHGAVANALRLKSMAPFPVIVGEEILTPHGEIMGLFLTERVPSPLPAQEAVARIKAQGGLVCIPHPFDRLRGSALGGRMVEMLLPEIDIIEVFNSRTHLLRDLARALSFAQSHGFAAGAGSDAHTPAEIGRAYVEMPQFNGRDEFLQSLAQGRIFGRRSSPFVHLAGLVARLRKRLGRA